MKHLCVYGPPLEIDQPSPRAEWLVPVEIHEAVIDGAAAPDDCLVIFEEAVLSGTQVADR